MERFSQDIIHTLALLFVAATVLWYFWVALRTRRVFLGNTSPDAFLRYRTDDPGGVPPLSAPLLQASLMGSAFSLASSVYVYLNWAATDGAFVLWSPITWAGGALLLYLLRHQIFRESRNAWTLHGFLQEKYSSPQLKRLASIITSLVFLLQVVAEVYVGLSVLQIFVGPNVPLWILCAVAGAVFIGYSVIGGLPAIMITDHIKYRLIVFGLFLAAIGLFDQGGASAVKLIQHSISTTFFPSTSASWITLLSMIALNLPLLITDMSVWQRVGAAESEREVTRGLGTFALTLLPYLAVIVFIGIAFGGFLLPPAGYTTAQAILAFFSDSLVFIFLLAGLFAALLTTADNYLIASVQTILVDWTWAERLERVGYRPEDLPQSEQRSMLRTAEVGVVVLGFGSVLLGYLFLKTLPSLLDLLFVIFGIQAALTPSVVYGLLGKARPTDARAGIASLVIGGVIGLICLGLALAGLSLLGVSYGLWSPVFVLGASSITFFALRGHTPDRRQQD